MASNSALWQLSISSDWYIYKHISSICILCSGHWKYPKHRFMVVKIIWNGMGEWFGVYFSCWYLHRGCIRDGMHHHTVHFVEWIYVVLLTNYKQTLSNNNWRVKICTFVLKMRHWWNYADMTSQQLKDQQEWMLTSIRFRTSVNILGAICEELSQNWSWGSRNNTPPLNAMSIIIMLSSR